ELAKRCLAAERLARPADAGVVAQDVTAYLASAQERLRQAQLERVAAETRAQEAGAKAKAERRARGGGAGPGGGGGAGRGGGVGGGGGWWSWRWEGPAGGGASACSRLWTARSRRP